MAGCVRVTYQRPDAAWQKEKTSSMSYSVRGQDGTLFPLSNSDELFYSYE